MRNVWLLVVVAACLVADSGAGVQWTPPKNWQAQAQRPMRLATYVVPEGGECGVYYFGPGQGGSVQANLDRWIGQFQQPDGKPKIQNKTIHGLKVTTVDIAGAYTGMGGPMAQGSAPKPGYRLLGAIVETPQGSIFFKFAGPQKTVAANQAGFEKMIASLGMQGSGGMAGVRGSGVQEGPASASRRSFTDGSSTRIPCMWRIRSKMLAK